MVNGIRTMSSSLVEDVLVDPEEAITPMTVNEPPLMVTLSPTGDCPENSSSAVSEPSTTTLFCWLRSEVVMNRPLVRLLLRTVSQSGVIA